MNKPIVLHEDDPDLRQLVRELLEDQGYTVHDAPRIEDLLVLARRLTPCVALIDSTSPTAFDLWYLGPLLAQLGVPALAFTAHATARQQFEDDPQGYVGVVSKPFDADEFINVVDSICWEESNVVAS
jgi:two-component system, NtrC family, nitrogen regulation response regulator NtrX